MGQIAKDWEQLKALIRQKNDVIDRQAAQIAALQKQVAAQQQQLPDADDQKAVAELRRTVGDNAPPASGAPATPKAAGATTPSLQAATSQAPGVTTFTK